MGLKYLFADGFSCLLQYMGRATYNYVDTYKDIDYCYFSVNPILLKPVLGIVLAIDPVLLKMEQLMSWLQSGHHAGSFSLWWQL